MRSLIAAILFCVMGLSGLAQFSVTPIDSIYETIYADSTISIFQIDLINATSDSLSLSWKLIEENVTEGWDYNLCDLGECYTGVPNSAEMQTFGASEAGFLKMLVNPLAIEGYGFWHFWVYPTGDQDNYVNLYFSINASLSASIEELGATFTLAPNPANDLVQIISQTSVNAVQLYSINGSLINELKPQQQLLNLSDIRPGMYMVAVSNQSGTAIQKLVVE